MTPLAKQTIMSQYANSDNLIKIIDDLSERLECDTFADNFYQFVMSINTAGSWGLDVWGRIVGVSRRTQLPPQDGEFFGFKREFYPFNSRPMYGGFDSGASHELSNAVFRRLILAKAAANIIDATVININAILNILFPDNHAYILITGHMQLTYVFESVLTPEYRQIVFNTDVLPRPCGVEVLFVENPGPPDN